MREVARLVEELRSKERRLQVGSPCSCSYPLTSEPPDLLTSFSRYLLTPCPGAGGEVKETRGGGAQEQPAGGGKPSVWNGVLRRVNKLLIENRNENSKKIVENEQISKKHKPNNKT